MKLYIAKWPDNSLTIVTASSKRDLFFKLDEEANPAEAQVTCVNFKNDVHITTRFAFDSKHNLVLEDGAAKFDWSLGSYADGSKETKVKI